MMVEKGIRHGICQAIYRYAKENNKYMRKEYNENTESSYLAYLDANNLYGRAMSQKLPVDSFQWVEEDDTPKFNESFINYDRNSDKGYILEVDVEDPKKLFNLQVIYHFYLKERKSENVIGLFVPYKTKKTVVHIRVLKQVLNHGLILKKHIGK